MSNHLPIRVRFAPSPTGIMHLGNVRTALMNYLFATQKQGTFIIRIEDTDQQRNIAGGTEQILSDLAWLNLDYQEGPVKGGPHIPYVQSEREAIYAQHLQMIIDQKLAYRCFCSAEELEKKRQRQIALKLPPRYDRTCLALSNDQIQSNVTQGTPFIWRFKLPDTTITIHDLARGQITFDMKHFSDFAISRQDGTSTFMFANFVDDMVMEMSHVIRGEDHLTNTAGQAALYHAFNAQLPLFWHLPIIGNAQGQKLSKRDFGFSLHDLRNEGYLPEAIDNYLAIIGGGSFEHEIMDLQTLASSLNFDTMHATGQVRYDLEKLCWINHKWIDRLPVEDLARRCLPYIQKAFPTQAVTAESIIPALRIVKTDIVTLADTPKALAFILERPVVGNDLLLTNGVTQESIESMKKSIESVSFASSAHELLDATKKEMVSHGTPAKQFFLIMRIALTGSAHGPALADIVTLLGDAEAKERIKRLS